MDHRVSGLLRELQDGVRNYLDSDTFTEWLTAVSLFHRYSINNIFLILMQYAAEDIMFIHNKMPVIFPSSDSALLHEWLDPNAMPPWDVNRVINKAATDVVFEKSPRTMSRKRRA